MSGVHGVTSKESRLRRWLLYLFARYIEVPALAWSYHLLRGKYRRFGQNRIVRFLIGWLVAAPFGYLGDTAFPVPASELGRLVDELEGPIAVGPCRCRSAHNACDHPQDTDMVIRTGVEAWRRAFPDEYRLISPDEAKAIVGDCHQLGMWPMVFVHCPVGAEDGIDHHENEYVICNCCTCGCVPYIINRELGQKIYPLIRGAYVAVTDTDGCAGHGECVAACPFDVRIIESGKSRLVDECFGCGVCVAACPEQAISMRPRAGAPPAVWLPSMTATQGQGEPA